jgi:hypothetical protein
MIGAACAAVTLRLRADDRARYRPALTYPLLESFGPSLYTASRPAVPFFGFPYPT